MRSGFQIYSGQDLSSFFRDWVFTPGYSVVLLDSFQNIEANGSYSIDLYLKQKLKGRADFHDDVPVYYTVYDENGSSESGKVAMSGEFETVSINAGIDPHYIALYERNELAQARTVDRVTISEQGSLNVDNMKWDVNVEAIEDSATVWFEHIWSAPDFQKDWDNKPYRLSNYHYWRVSGMNMDNLEMSGRFFYDGREGGNTGYMDMDLVSVQEDSLVLLFRASTADDWIEFEHYEKNILGASDNGFGLIELDQILPGEYALANMDHSVLNAKSAERDSQLRIFPNPASDEITIEIAAIQNTDSMDFNLYDGNGKSVLNSTLSENITRIDIQSLPSGVYHYTVLNSNNTWNGSIVIR